MEANLRRAMDYSREWQREEESMIEQMQQALQERMERKQGIELLMQQAEHAEQECEMARRVLESANRERDKLKDECVAQKEEIAQLKEKISILEKQQKELGQMTTKVVKEAGHDDLLKALRKFMNMSRRKSAEKRGIVKTYIMEMASCASVSLPDDMMEELLAFDDVEVKQMAINTGHMEMHVDRIERNEGPIHIEQQINQEMPCLS